MQGTLTLPALLLIERDPEGNPVKRYFAGRNRAKNLETALQMVRDSDILDESFKVAYDFRDKALSALSGLDGGDGDAGARESLTDVAYWVTQRRS
jgi:geranylgeranyl pyrophosphate synthase